MKKRLGKKIVHELVEMALVTLYFFITFSIIILLKVLILAQQNIEFSSISGAVGGSLIMGKVVPLLYHTKPLNIFKGDYLYKNVLYKTIIFSLFADFLLFLEHFIVSLLDTHSFGETLKHMFDHPDWNQVWIVVICSFFSLLVYTSFTSIGEYIGEKNMMRFFFRAKGNRE